MRKLSQTQLTAHVNLVKWEEHKHLEKFNLLTVHSLLLNSNPQFIQLKTKIQTFNSMIDKKVQRKHLQYQYTKKLYQMLRYMVDIKNYEAQQQFLDQVYQWSKGGRIEGNFDEGSVAGSIGGKSRPTTATTRSRPFSAYSRPPSGVKKLGIIKLQQPVPIINPQKKTKTNTDYDKLKPGDVQFFTGQRTIHENEQKPKKRLKQYQRKIFYDEEQDSDLQIIDLKVEKPMFIFKTISGNPQLKQQQLAEEQLIMEGLEGGPHNLQDGENQPLQGDEEQAGEGQDDVNIDDLPLQGEGQQDEAQEVIDKLKPRFKAFVKHQTQLQKDQAKYVKGVHHYIEERNKLIRKNGEDQVIKTKMLEWAKEKSRTKREQKRRAQSARIVTKQVGIGYRKPTAKEENSNHINLEQFPIPQTKNTRPKTAFHAFNEANRKELIKNCFITGAVSSHIQKLDIQQLTSLTAQRQMRITSLAQRPKKKTFEQILRDAELRVKEQQDEEILNVKQKFARNKVPFEANRIAKSVTYHAGGEEEYEEDEDENIIGGGIVGLNMLNNPFFKVGKKKKKKKKKK